MSADEYKAWLAAVNSGEPTTLGTYSKWSDRVRNLIYRLEPSALDDLLDMALGSLEAIQAKAREWAAKAPEDDWGEGGIGDTIVADAGRVILDLIRKTSGIGAETP